MELTADMVCQIFLQYLSLFQWSITIADVSNCSVPIRVRSMRLTVSVFWDVTFYCRHSNTQASSRSMFDSVANAFFSHGYCSFFAQTVDHLYAMNAAQNRLIILA